jgi:hypothetical protein
MLYAIIGLVLGALSGILLIILNFSDILSHIEYSDVEDKFLMSLIVVGYLGAFLIAWPVCIVVLILFGIFTAIQKMRE